MKKRRELDALVGGVKSRRKSSNSNSSHELLRYNGSESSDDDYRLTSPKVRGSGLCSTCTSVFIFLLLVACILVCAGLTWMHVEMKKDLEILRVNLQAVEGRSMGSTDDVEKLFKQMASVNKTLEQQTKTLKSVISNLSTMNKTVLQLSGRMDKLGEGLKAAPELKQIPEKLQAVSQTVATMGSDIQNVKETVDKVSPFMKSTTDSLDALRKEFDSIKDQVNTDDSAPGRESVKPDMANVIQGFTSQLQTVNSTVSTQLSVLMKSNSQQQDRISELEETTQMLMKNISAISTDHTSISSEHASLTDDYTSGEFKASVADIVHDLLSKESSMPSSSNVEGVMANISKALSNLNELEQKYESLDKQQSEAGPVDNHEDVNEDEVKYVTMEMFKTLGDSFETRVENLNNSFVKLKTNVGTMSQILTRQSNTVTNLTHQVEGTKMFLVTLQHKLEQTGIDSHPVTEAPVTEKSTAPKLTSVKPPLNTTKEQEVKTTEHGKQSSLGVTPEAATTTKKLAVSVDWIKNEEDLKKNYRIWSGGEEHEVSFDDLNLFLGPHTPEEEVLEAFDKDGNGLYSLEEFSAAFGIPLTQEEPVTDATAPPR